MYLLVCFSKFKINTLFKNRFIYIRIPLQYIPASKYVITNILSFKKSKN